jgi:Uma2 family endonuclease
MIFADETLTLVTKSRIHEWYAERLAAVVKALAGALSIEWEDAGGATYRREDLSAGVEGDKTFYFAEHAKLMTGGQNIDLSVQPPPDLAIEVEVTNSADAAMLVWGRLGVPEVWRLDPNSMEFGFWSRRDDGAYEWVEVSGIFAGLRADLISKQLRLAGELGAARWEAGLAAWARDLKTHGLTAI